MLNLYYTQPAEWSFHLLLGGGYTFIVTYSWKNDNDNDNILSDHNVKIEITIFNSLENQIINGSGEYY